MIPVYAIIYPARPPDQSSLNFAHALATASELPGIECLRLAVRFYDLQFDKDNPARVPLKQGYDISLLEDACRKDGFILELTAEPIV